MNKSILFLVLSLAFITAGLQGQIHSYCGTRSTDMKWLDRYVENREAYSEEWGAVTYIPIQIHLVGQDNGSKRMTIPKILETLAKFNSDMEQAELRFFLKDDFNNLDNTAWYDHDFGTGLQMMRSNNTTGALNIFVVGSPAGNCGYYSPAGDAIALSTGCSGGNSSTLTHEMGHMLSLPHTFFGCEGVRYDPSQPLSTFKAQIRGTLERVDKSNCRQAADRFCDTEPDYLSYRWTCSGDGRSTVELVDENDTPFRADGRLFMSYSNDRCTNRFSDEQIQAMKHNINDRRSSLIAAVLPQSEIGGNVEELILPNTQVLDPAQPVLMWEEAPNATRYYVQIAKRKSFGGRAIFKGVVKETSLLLPQLEPGSTYYVRFYPYNFVSFDMGYSKTFSFKTAEVTAASSVSQKQVQLQNNLIASGTALRILSTTAAPLELRITDLNGREYMQRSIQGEGAHEIDASWPAGYYVLTVKDRNSYSVRHYSVILY